MGRVLVQQPGTNTAKALTETLPKNVIIVDEDLHQLRLHDGVTPGGHVIGGGGGEFRKEVGERNIGEIVYSTVPITDSGLHLADGEVLDGTGIYKDFYDYMVAKATSAPDIFTTEANWQAEVAANGVCGKYVLDTDLSSIRLPKLKNKLLTDNAVVGNGVTVGLTDGTDNFGLNNVVNYALSIARDRYGTNVGVASSGAAGVAKTVGITTDGTKSGIEVASSVDIYCYVVIANTAKVPVQVDIDNIATELNACYAHRVVEFQEPTATNGYTWYRKYADGWVEQGGVATITSNGNSITLPIEMTDANYCVFSIVMINTGAYNRCYSRNTTTISMASSGGNNTSSWIVCGMAA